VLLPRMPPLAVLAALRSQRGVRRPDIGPAQQRHRGQVANARQGITVLIVPRSARGLLNQARNVSTRKPYAQAQRPYGWDSGRT